MKIELEKATFIEFFYKGAEVKINDKKVVLIGKKDDINLSLEQLTI